MVASLREQEYLERIRAYELHRIERHLPSPAMIIELGGAGGQQADLLRDAGHTVRSFDIEPAANGRVELYDGVHLPLPDGCADVVYSSNTLEHVVDLDGLLAECRRVLKPGGISVHVLPTPTWRVLSILDYYPFVARAIFRRLRRQGADAADASDAHRVAGPSTRRATWKLLFPGPHGEFPTSAHEVVEYSEARWRARFERAGFRVVTTASSGLVYDGYSFVPGLSFGVREQLAKVLGAAGKVFVLVADNAC
jgi:SAM-dependent methyltransferase